MKSHIAKSTRAGVEWFVLDVKHADGRRQRTSFRTMKEAEQAEEALKTQIAIGGNIWLTLSAKDQAEAMFVMKEAQDIGISLRALLDFYKSHKPKAGSQHRVTLAKMIEMTIQAKRLARRRERYVSHLESILNSFAAGRQSMFVDTITTQDIEDWIGTQKGKGGGPATASTIHGLLNRVSAMFAVAVRKEIIERNPVEKIERPKVELERPDFFTCQQASDLLWVCRQTDKDLLAYIVLGMFAGIRPEELPRLKWNDVHIAEREIHIDASVSKVGVGRPVPMEETLAEWLKECVPSGEFIVNIESPVARDLDAINRVIGVRRRMLAQRAGITWANDILRKTAATYLMSKHQNENLVSYWLGNSPKILRRHYNAVGRRADGDKFWALTPTVVPNTPIEKGPK